MVTKKINIAWTVSARRQFLDIIIYLQNESPLAAELVFNAISSKIESLPKNPKRYPADSLKKDGDRSFRTFSVYSYRITYRITAETIYIYRIRHTSREPKEF